MAKFSKSKRTMEMVGRVAILSLMLLILPSCGIPHLRHPEPGPQLPETFNGVTTSENSSQVPIDEFFEDPILTGLIDQALMGNQELKILAQNIAIANNETLARSGAYLPFFGIGGGAGMDKPSLYTRAGAVDNSLNILPGQRIPSPLPNYLTATTLTWQIDIWRQLRNARDAAALRYLGTSEGRNYIVTRLVAEIAESYYGLMALDKRLENLDQIIELQEQSLKVAEAKKLNARGTELAVQRFQAEVSKNQSEKLIVRQEIIELENRINFLLGRYPQVVPRVSPKFIEMNLHTLDVGVPSELLRNRPDIRQAERELEAAGLDVKVARARFYPTFIISGAVGYEAFNPRYFLITPEALAGGIAGNLVAPLINKRAIQAEYMSANATQLQAVYNYQRVILNAFTEVINRVTMEQNYRKSIEIKKEQVRALVASVDSATKLFRAARPEVDYMDVLFAQRDLLEARRVLIETKRQQLSAVVNAYQALGGGLVLNPGAAGNPPQGAFTHTVRPGETFKTISQLYYTSDRYYKALWAANKGAVPTPDILNVGENIVIPPVAQLDPALYEQQLPAASPNTPASPDQSNPPQPPPPDAPGPFRPEEPASNPPAPLDPLDVPQAE